MLMGSFSLAFAGAHTVQGDSSLQAIHYKREFALGKIDQGEVVVVKTYRGEKLRGTMRILSDELVEVAGKPIPVADIKRIKTWIPLPDRISLAGMQIGGTLTWVTGIGFIHYALLFLPFTFLVLPFLLGISMVGIGLGLARLATRQRPVFRQTKKLLLRIRS